MPNAHRGRRAFIISSGKPAELELSYFTGRNTWFTERNFSL